MKASRNGENSLSFTDIVKSCQSLEFVTWQICLLTLFAKIKFSRKFPNLQYASRTSNSFARKDTDREQNLGPELQCFLKVKQDLS